MFENELLFLGKTGPNTGASVCRSYPIMKKNLVVVSCLAIMSVALVYGQAGAPPAKAHAPARQPKAQAQAATPGLKAGTPTAQPGHTAAEERALVDKYCVGCHNTRAKAAGLDSSLRLTLDDVDFANVAPHAQKLERVARKLRAGS